MSEQRGQWGTRAGFILAAVGSAIGLGNIWRFPAVAYDNGGGAFFIPYLFALLTAGIPLLILEFTIGHKYRGSSPFSFTQMSKKAEWLGWWQVLISFVISTYYAVIIAWAIMYSYFGINRTWGDDTEAFLFGDYLNLAEAPGQFGSLVPSVLIPLIVVWVVVLGVLFKGVKKGIEKANKIFIPALIVIFFIIVLRAVTLDGADVGLDTFFKPDWGALTNGSVWVAAYGQIFFSLSIAFAIMITYSSYLPKKSDITNNAFITGFSNSAFELLAGIGVFSALGFMAVSQGVEVKEVVSGGVGLAFVVFPSIINEFPALNGLFGFLFFASLVLAGFSSLISITETYVAALSDKFNISRKKAVVYGGGTAAIISLLFATQGGLFLLDTVDHFVMNFGVAASGLVEAILVVWVLRKLTEMKRHANGVSDIRLGFLWTLCLGVITPLVLGYQMFLNLRNDIINNYEGYPTSFLISYGWVVAGAIIVLGIIFSLGKWHRQPSHAKEAE